MTEPPLRVNTAFCTFDATSKEAPGITKNEAPVCVAGPLSVAVPLIRKVDPIVAAIKSADVPTPMLKLHAIVCARNVARADAEVMKCTSVTKCE